MNLSFFSIIQQLSSKVFKKSKPMSGEEYDILAALVHKNAKKKSSIPGMK